MTKRWSGDTLVSVMVHLGRRCGDPKFISFRFIIHLIGLVHNQWSGDTRVSVMVHLGGEGGGPGLITSKFHHHFTSIA